MSEIESIRGRVQSFVQRLLGTAQAVTDHLGSWPIRYGSATVYVSVVPLSGSGNHLVKIFAATLLNIPHSPAHHGRA